MMHIVKSFQLSYSTDTMIRASVIAAIFLIPFAAAAAVGKERIS